MLKWHYSIVQADRGRGICPLFHPQLGRFDSSRVPTPGNLPSKAKRNANSRGSARGGGGWAQVELLYHALKSYLSNIQISLHI